MNNTELQLLQIIADMGDSTDGAFNIRANGQLANRRVTENIDIKTKTDNPGIRPYSGNYKRNRSQRPCLQ